MEKLAKTMFAEMLRNYVIAKYPELRDPTTGTVTKSNICEYVSHLPQEVQLNILACKGIKKENLKEFLDGVDNFGYWAKFLNSKASFKNDNKILGEMQIAFIPCFCRPDNQQQEEPDDKFRYQRKNLEMLPEEKSLIEEKFKGILKKIGSKNHKECIKEILFLLEKEYEFPLDYFEIQVESKQRDAHGGRCLTTVVANYDDGEVVSIYDFLYKENRGLSLYAFVHNRSLWCNATGENTSLEDGVPVVNSWPRLRTENLPAYWKSIEYPERTLNTFIVVPLKVPNVPTCYGFLSFDSTEYRTYNENMGDLFEDLAEIVSYNLIAKKL